MTETASGSAVTDRVSPSPLLTFLIADVRGYTRFTVEQGDERAAHLAERFAALCEEIVGQHEGRMIELRGDEALAVFPSARNALRGAVALQQVLHEAMATDPSLPLNVGMGLDAGEAIPVRGGYRGGALNLAARLCSIAGAGEILASETVIGLARKTEGLIFVDRGQVTLKGLSSPVRVLQIAPEGTLPSALPPLQPILATHPTNLPDDPTPFIGREEEIAALGALLQAPHIRLVTLTGPGGTGKSRLALQLGNTLLHHFADGIFFVSLASLADPALVPSTLADVLSVKEESGEAITKTLIEYLRKKHLLLVLDNFEHLPDAREVVSALLDECRTLHILVTSRIPLHVSREHEYPVPTLAVPDLQQLPDPATLSQNEAVALFIERAGAVKPGFEVTNENAPAVAEICFRLDGLPLAIELAAARIKLFPPQALLQRLSSTLKFLTGGPRDRPSRQQTLRGTIDWSYSLLSAEEQRLFARLSVFVGGCTFEAAECVCNADGELDLLEGLTLLVDKSLVRQEGQDEPRFTMLETIHEYAAEASHRSGEVGELERLHAEYFLDVGKEQTRRVRGPQAIAQLVDLERDLDNYRAALSWLLGHARAREALDLASALSSLWYARGHLREGRRWLNEALPSLGEQDIAARARALSALASLTHFQGDHAEAARLAEDSLILYRSAGDRRGMASALRLLGSSMMFAEQYERAQEHLRESAALWREVGDRDGLATTLTNLGDTMVRAGRYEPARQALEEGLDLWRELDSPMGGYPLYKLGVLALEQGDLKEARRLLTESASLARGNREGEIMTLQFAAAVASAEGNPVQCAHLFGSAEAFAERIGSRRLTADHGRNEQKYISDARARLGEDGWNKAWEAGRAMGLEEAIAYALSESA